MLVATSTRDDPQIAHDDAAPGVPGSRRFLNWARWMLVALAVVIPISTALTNIGFGLLLLFWLASGTFPEKLRLLRRSPAALMSIFLFAFIGVATLYSEAGWPDAAHYWLGCRKWLLIPLAVTLVGDARWQMRILTAFAGSATFLLAASLVLAAFAPPLLGETLLQQRAHFAAQGIYGVIGEDPTSQSLVFLLATGICLHLAAGCMAPAGARRYALWGLAALFVLDIIYLSGGRTGFVLCLVVLPLVAWQLMPTRRFLLACTLLACALPVFWFSSAHLRTRSLAVVQDVQRYDAIGHAEENNSTGLRLSFYRNGLALIGARPILGYGAGSIETVYRRLLDSRPGSADVPTANLHNEYLNMTAQFGVVGLLVFLAWLYSHWAGTRTVGPPAQPLARLALAAFAVGSLANSLFTTSHEGHLYALIIGVLLAPAAAVRQEPEGSAQ